MKKLLSVFLVTLLIVSSMASVVSAKQNNKTPIPVQTPEFPVFNVPSVTNIISDGGGSGNIGTTTYGSNGTITYRETQSQLMANGVSVTAAFYRAGIHIYITSWTLGRLLALSVYGTTIAGLLGAFAASVGGVSLGVFLASASYYLKIADSNGGYNGVTLYQSYSNIGIAQGWKIYSGKQLYRYN